MSVLQLRDHPSPHRKRILRWMFRNYPDLLRFYLFGGRLSRVPIVGPLLAHPLLSNYGYFAHGGMALPLAEMNEIIDQAQDIVVAECPCRALENNCDLPRTNCLKLNTAAKVLLEELREQGRRVSREEAKAIIAESYARGMMLQLEWCINPFHYDICSCCKCCCVARRLRFEFDVEGALQAGPYLPEISHELCTECLECSKVCPADAITALPKPSISEEKCVGCGLCQSVCPTSAIQMKPERVCMGRKTPSSFSLFIWWLAAIFLLVPEVMLFNLVFKRIPSKS
ncbi:MAG: 4Fe-4S binding protein [Candidatus Hydrogenedentota bacterium]|nr:MAG: 4Fe-4S binding protein [Candidatus Hydrogenedentota bacterium]